MSEATKTLEELSIDGKQRFKNGDVCPDDPERVCWGMIGDSPWWVSWKEYWSMAKRHKGVVRQRRKVDGVQKRGML